MFKIAAITDEISQDPAVAARLVREFGGEGLEIRSVWEKGPHELASTEIRRLKQIADAHGLQICGIASPVFKCTLGVVEEERQHLDILRRCIDLAHALDTDLIRVRTREGWSGRPGGRPPPRATKPSSPCSSTDICSPCTEPANTPRPSSRSCSASPGTIYREIQRGSALTPTV